MGLGLQCGNMRNMEPRERSLEACPQEGQVVLELEAVLAPACSLASIFLCT